MTGILVRAGTHCQEDNQDNRRTADDGRTREVGVPEIALHTRLRAGAEAEYERLHRRIPADLVPALRAAGVRDWRIWRDGQDLFHLVDVEDYRAMRAALRDHPANLA